MKKAKVSVIVPVYNVEKYLPKCLDTLVNQTLEEIEILVINDGSPDNSQAIIDDYVRRYPTKVRSFVKENGGLSDARNYGVERATGEYLAFVDSDDYVRADMFELLYNKAVEDSADVVTCNFYFHTDEHIKNNTVITHPEHFGLSIEESPEILLESKSYAWNKIYRRQWYCDNNFQFPIGQWFEDSAVVYNILYMADKVSAVTEFLYYYRVDRADSITKTISPKIFDAFISSESIRLFYYSHTTNKSVLKVAERLCQMHILARLEEVIKHGPVKMSLEFYTQMLNYFQRYMPKWTSNPYYKKIKKRNNYLKYRHNPYIMYPLLCIPRGKHDFVVKFLWKERSAKKSDYYISKPRLRELQMIELDILKEVDRICKEQGLTYYLGEGTLLGAIRHQGFIPWDDDLDIVMPRADYEKFLDVVNEKLCSAYACLNERTDPSYYLPFTKIISLDNHGFVNKLDKFEEKYRGPFLDIFPLDAFDTIDKKVIERKYKKIRKIRDILLLKAKYMVPRTWKKKWLNMISKFSTNEKLHTQLRKEMTMCDSSAEYRCNLASSYHPSRQIVSKEVYGEPRYVPFEGGLFPVPRDAEGLLTSVYGNYLRMPSVRKRICRHSFYDELSETMKRETQPIEAAETERLAQEELRKLQMYEFNILQEVDRVCKENDITYYLGGSTLRGAVLYQGFIPWSETVDIYMLWDDLEKFMHICDAQLKPNYKFQYHHNISQYWVQSPKVRLLDKTEFTQAKILKYTKDAGPVINILPLAYTSESFAQTQRQNKYIRRYRKILFLKTGFTKPKGKKQQLLKLYGYLVSVKSIHEKIDRMVTKYNHASQKYLVNFGSYSSLRKSFFPAEVFGAPEYLTFEGCEFPVPSNYKYVLAAIYGDYMELPPENKRVAKHSFD